MKHKIIIEINADEVAESAEFPELVDSIKECCMEQVNEVLALDSIDHGYYFSVYDKGKNNVRVEAKVE